MEYDLGREAAIVLTKPTRPSALGDWGSLPDHTPWHGVRNACTVSAYFRSHDGVRLVID